MDSWRRLESTICCSYVGANGSAKVPISSAKCLKRIYAKE